MTSITIALSCPTTLLIIDTHPVLRFGLRCLLENTITEHLTVVEAGSIEQAKEYACDKQIALTIMDQATAHKLLDSPTGADDRLLSFIDGVPVAVLCDGVNIETCQRLRKQGVVICISKKTTLQVIASAISLVLLEGTSQVLLGKTSFTHGLHCGDCYPESLEPALDVELAAIKRYYPGDVSLPLTARQREILDLIVQGHSNKEIARVLDISVGTTKNHVAAILHAIDVKRRGQVMQKVLSSGLAKV